MNITSHSKTDPSIIFHTIIGIDSLKGCLSSAEAGQAAAEGVRLALERVGVNGHTDILTLADGGEGMAEAIASSRPSVRVTVDTVDPLGRPIKGVYWRSPDGDEAWIDMAAASGLPLLAAGERDPLRTSTFGTGIMIRHAMEGGASNIILGLGGSATNDAGLGILQALGWRFTDRGGEILTGHLTGGDLMRVTGIDSREVGEAVRKCRLTLACDVTAPLFGPEGAAYVFAPQKGADPDTVETLDSGLRNVAAVVERATGKDCSSVPGGGAAGGCGATLHGIAGAEIRNGARTVTDFVAAGIDWKAADLIITGEGHADRQTLMGKAPAEMLRRGKEAGVPVALLAGSISDRLLLAEAGFSDIADINEEGRKPDEPYGDPLVGSTAARRIAETVRRIVEKRI